MVSNKSLRKEICTRVNDLSDIRAFKAHLEIAFFIWPLLESNWSVDFNFTALIVTFILRALTTFRYLEIK